MSLADDLAAARQAAKTARAERDALARDLAFARQATQTERDALVAERDAVGLLHGKSPNSAEDNAARTALGGTGLAAAVPRAVAMSGNARLRGVIREAERRLARLLEQGEQTSPARTRTRLASVLRLLRRELALANGHRGKATRLNRRSALPTKPKPMHPPLQNGDTQRMQR